MTSKMRMMDKINLSDAAYQISLMNSEFDERLQALHELLF